MGFDVNFTIPSATIPGGVKDIGKQLLTHSKKHRLAYETALTTGAGFYGAKIGYEKTKRKNTRRS